MVADMSAVVLFTLSLASTLADIAAEAKGHVGFAAEIVETGAAIGLDEGRHYPMQSVYKLPIAMAVLHAVDERQRALDEPVRIAAADLVPRLHSPLRDRHPEGVTLSLREVLRYALVESDGTASDVLLALLGGPAAAERYVRGLGVSDLAIATSEREMLASETVQYRNWSSPRAAVQLLRILQRDGKWSPASRGMLLELLTQSRPGPNRIKGMLPAGVSVAHKTGTSATVAGVTRATNDIGLVTLPDGRHLAIAVFVADAAADERARERVIARLARAAYDWAMHDAAPAPSAR
jgi:beta-lactamase class A